MKSYNHLYEELISKDNILLGIANSSEGKRDRPEVFKIFVFQNEYVPHFQELIEDFPIYKHTSVQIYDGIVRKVRHIIVPSYEEQVVHHSLVNVLKPIIYNSLYLYSCGSIPNRGAHFAKEYLEKKIKYDKYNTKYCLKMDIRKFFDSIRHDILKKKIEEKIHDKKFLTVLYRVIDVTEEGLPLGFYTSQWLANWFLSDLDHYIKETLKVKYYVRYMDDMTIFDHDKNFLHIIKNKIQDFLHIIGLELKSNWQIFRFDYTDKEGNHYGRFLDFMGFRFYSDKVILRKSILIKACKKARKMGKKDKVTVFDCKQILSYLGWIDCTNTYNMYLKYIKPYVNFKYCKQRVSKFDRRLNKWRKRKYEDRIRQLFIDFGADDFGRYLIA